MSERLLWNEVSRIVALDAQPVLRNLLITQCYHDLSQELGRVLGVSEANWCTFATWASKTAGRFIRNEEVPALFNKLLADAHDFQRSWARLVDQLSRLQPQSALAERGLLGLAEKVLEDVSGQIRDGNLKVFAELAPVFARFIHAFDGGVLDPGAEERLLGSLREGPSSQDGQSLLKEAMQQYFSAARESDPALKVQRMLLANALTGLHEQIRLQPYIAGSLNAPIADTLGKLFHQHAHQGDGSLFGIIHALWDRLGAAVVNDAEKAWALFASVELMTLAVPGQVLSLGKPLPAAPGKPLYPAALSAPHYVPLVELLEQYDALDPEARGQVGATDWTVLAQRMRYILALFRSRQEEPTLQQQPFSPAQHQAILEDKIPSGALS